MNKGKGPIPEGLLEAMAAHPVEEICADRVALARRHARLKAYNDDLVLEEIAVQLLALSTHR